MLGDQGAEMLKMLEGGSEGLQEMRLEAKTLGVSSDASLRWHDNFMAQSFMGFSA